jgi:hypothetical protein
VNVERPCWISKLEPFNGMWHLSENGKPRGKFDAIVVAHNGNLIMSLFFLFKNNILQVPFLHIFQYGVFICIVIRLMASLVTISLFADRKMC